MLKDYTQTLDRLQMGLGRAYMRSPSILGIPGMSIAVKIDPNYYLAVMPAFIHRMAEWGGMFPDTAEDALMRTGNLITSGPDRDYLLELGVVWGIPPVTKRIRCALVLAEFVDRALRLHGRRAAPLPVADLRVIAADRERVDSFLDDKTPLDKTAFSSQI
ncbi:hypothetical protein GGQ74_002468 [Desulfobaculum xiamenense]|uniref:Uncharacterized protein n=1 Tax=Desulfobaculum xiamenense TaxID=995050 RepID=A0A846QTJ5_9BACT|nr:hypothetical protein [Desulfobaculum xiamenense]NJB68795.1 hypothetical protein [Desulfobaculum xiamenense]